MLTPATGAVAAPAPVSSPLSSPAPVGKPAPRNQAAAPTSPKATQQSREKELVAKLAKAGTEAEAADIRSELEALRTKPLRPTTMLLLRRATRELSEQKPADAIEDLGAALALQSDAAVLWRLRAQAKLAGGDTDGAVSDLGIAVQHDADDAVNWETLTAVEEARSDGPAAFRAWQRAMELDPKLPGAETRLEKLRLKAFGQPT
ncbi:hypothetical protein GOB93_08570 [Acetobacter musti]|uniref:Tetratricopeptide repeat protein n=2 Tax=Acetobacter musti TaxID=864732 RepID=A0ABX0JS11_9PROT|nr:hypothetical protein [Acetobacter musti]